MITALLVARQLPGVPAAHKRENISEDVWEVCELHDISIEEFGKCGADTGGGRAYDDDDGYGDGGGMDGMPEGVQCAQQ